MRIIGVKKELVFEYFKKYGLENYYDEVAGE